MTSHSKIFFQIGGIVFLGLLAAYLAAHAKSYVARETAHFSYNPTVASTTRAANSEVDEEDPHISGFSSVSTYSGGQDVETDDSVWIVPAITGPITAQEYLVLDLHSGAILEDKGLDRVAPMASLTKLVTAEVSRELMASTTEITITDTMLAAYGSNGHLREGEIISAGELLYPLLLVSSNDSAEALAQGYESDPTESRKDFIRAMNDWVHSIGAYRTNFYDPSGLSPLTVSTARDQATILQWILKNDPALVAITDQRSATVRLHTWTNSTHFLNLSNYVGGKDGYIPEAGETAASLFSADTSTAAALNAINPPARYLVVVLGSANRDNDVLSLLEKAEGK